MKNSVREMAAADAESIVDYFVNADAAFLNGMGAKKELLPSLSAWIDKLLLELEKPIESKELFYVIWMVNDEPIGHSNLNWITYGKQANMHLHIWNGEHRRGGNGLVLLRQTIPMYFDRFKLQTLICEPYAENPAPSKTLPKVGFEFVRSHETTPGPICFPQTVNRFEMSKERFREVFRK